MFYHNRRKYHSIDIPSLSVIVTLSISRGPTSTPGRFGTTFSVTINISSLSRMVSSCIEIVTVILSSLLGKGIVCWLKSKSSVSIRDFYIIMTPTQRVFFKLMLNCKQSTSVYILTSVLSTKTDNFSLWCSTISVYAYFNCHLDSQPLFCIKKFKVMLLISDLSQFTYQL